MKVATDACAHGDGAGGVVYPSYRKKGMWMTRSSTFVKLENVLLRAASGWR